MTTKYLDGVQQVELTVNAVQIKTSDNGPLYQSNGVTDGSNGGGTLATGGFLFNGSTWDRVRNNIQGTLLTSQARTAQPATPTQTNYNAKGVQILLKVTAVGGTGGLKPHFAVITQSGIKSWLSTPAVITAVGQYVYELYPGVSGTGGDIQQRNSGCLPRTWTVDVEHVDGSSYTYQLEYALIQ